MKRLLILGLVLCIGQARAQHVFTPDVIWYNTGKSIYIQFSLPSIYDLNHFAEASKIFSGLYSESTQQQLKSLNENSGISILLNNKFGRPTITEGRSSIAHYIPGDLMPDSSALLQELKVIIDEEIEINCLFSNVADLMLFLKNDWGKSISLITAEYPKLPSWNKRKAICLHYRQIGDTIQNTSVSPNPTFDSWDLMELIAETGIGSFKGKILPNLTVGIGLMFSQKGILKDNYFLNYELMYDFVSENGKSVPKSGHFIDAGYARNFTKNPDKANWYGISVGYLVRKNSEIFDDKTWRLSIHRNISKHIVLIPQFYFPNDFSNLFPGVKIQVSF